VTGIVLDAGALIAIDRGDRKIKTILKTVTKQKLPVVVPANVLIQAWRDGAKQALLAKFLKEDWVTVTPVTDELARLSGVLLGKSSKRDAIDASVVATAVQLGIKQIITSDPEDIAKLGPGLEVVPI
jgi:predicted nucleic acid-binding protein